MRLYSVSQRAEGLTPQEILQQVRASLEGLRPRRALLLPPDYTRYFSNAGQIANFYYHELTARGCAVDVMPALGTHAPMTAAEIAGMYGDIPPERFLVHNWRTDVVRLGEVPAAYLSDITEGLWTEPVSAEINRRVMDGQYDLILSLGQVVPHEVVGMSSHAKNLFVGVGGSDMINKSHMVGAVYGMERMMGREDTPVRRIFDYGMEHFLAGRPILFALTVTTAPGGKIRTHGLFIGEERDCFTQAVKLAQEKNIDFVPSGIPKCVVYLPPEEFKSTWLGNKAIYRTRMAVADGGELLILAPGVRRFGEDAEIDALIRKYGYCGRAEILRRFRENDDLRGNMSAAAHLIHGSADGRFRITYAVNSIPRREVEGVGFSSADFGEAAARYDPARLSYGWNTLPDGERIFFIPNPALGLWINREKFGG